MRRGFTLTELVVVIIIILILVAILLPAVNRSGGSTHRVMCANHLKCLGLALTMYHDTHGHFPAAMGGTGGETELDGNNNRLSGLVAVLPFMEQQYLWNEIATPKTINGIDYPVMGPAPWVSAYPSWARKMHDFDCPAAVKDDSAELGQTNYAFCIGDMARNIHQPETLRGAFACGRTSHLDDFTDGQNQTIMVAEIGTVSKRLVSGQFATNLPANILESPIQCKVTAGGSYHAKVPLSKHGRGGRWADGAAGFSLVNTILPPNSPSCAIGGAEAVDGLYSAGSGHYKGAHVLLADGSCRFISNTIDCGDSTRPTPTLDQMTKKGFASPYGVWGALGTIAGEEPEPTDF